MDIIHNRKLTRIQGSFQEDLRILRPSSPSRQKKLDLDSLASDETQDHRQYNGVFRAGDWNGSHDSLTIMSPNVWALDYHCVCCVNERVEMSECAELKHEKLWANKICHWSSRNIARPTEEGEDKSLLSVNNLQIASLNSSICGKCQAHGRHFSANTLGEHDLALVYGNLSWATA